MQVELKTGNFIIIDGVRVECVSANYNTVNDVDGFYFEEWPDHPTGFKLVGDAALVGPSASQDNVLSTEFYVTSPFANLSGFSMQMFAEIPTTGPGKLSLDASMTNPPDFTFAQPLNLVASDDEVTNGPNLLADEIVFTPQDTGIPTPQTAISVTFSAIVNQGTVGQIDSVGISHVSPSMPVLMIESAKLQGFSTTGSMGQVIGSKYKNCHWPPRLEAPVALFAAGSKRLVIEGPPTPRNVVFPPDTVFIGITKAECFFVRHEEGGIRYVASITSELAALFTSGAKTLQEVKELSTFVTIESSLDDPNLRVFQLVAGVMTDVTP